jgi:hypothetical protein
VIIPTGMVFATEDPTRRDYFGDFAACLYSRYYDTGTTHHLPSIWLSNHREQVSKTK